MSLTGTWAIDYTNKIISYVSDAPAGGDTVRDLYSWLMDSFDELATLDDTIPMAAQTPTEFTLINGWFIDDVSMQYLKGGAITTVGWIHNATYPQGVRVLTLSAAANLSAADIGKVVLGGTTGDTGKLLAYNVSLKKLWVRCDSVGDTFANTTEAITVDGQACGNMTIASETGESIYGNLYTLGTIETGGTIYIEQSAEKITGWWSTGHIDVLVKVQEFSSLIDSGNLIVFLREYTGTDGKLFDHFPITVTGGRNAVPLATSPDVNNTTDATTVAGWTNVVFTFADISRDLNNGAGAKPYKLSIDCGGRTVAQMYERTKYITRTGSTEDCGGIPGQLYISLVPATYAPVKPAPFGTFAGGKFFGARGVWLTNYADTDAKNFNLIDCNNDPQTPPNTVTMSVTSVAVADRVVVFRLTASGYPATGSIKKDEFGGCTVQSAEATTLVCGSTIDADVAGKATGGIIRITDSVGADAFRVRYSSWSGSTFTLASATLTPESGTTTTNIKDTGAFTAALCKVGDLIYNVTRATASYVTVRVDDDNVTISPAIASQTNTDTIKKNVLPMALDTTYNVYSPFIDEQALTTTSSNTLVQSTNIPVLIRVRKKGILPFEIESIIESTGKSVAAIRTTDSIVQ